MSDDVLVRVDNVSKRFCRSLKRSLWYGLQDLGSELGGHRHGGGGGLPQSSADVNLREDEFWAVKDVSFELRRGECLGLIGRNGAGKTTLLRMLNGLIKPDQGTIELRGSMGALIALGAGFNPALSGRENIYINGAVLGLKASQIKSLIPVIIDFADIGDAIDSPVYTYSSGMQARLGFSVATAISPDILVVDEVLAVGDTDFKLKSLKRMQEISRSGTCVILVSHSMTDIHNMATSALWMSKGRALSLGAPATVINQYLDSKISETNEIRWDERTAPGCKALKLRAAAVVPREGDILTIKSGGVVNIEFVCYQEDLNLDCTIEVLTEENIVVFHTGAIFGKEVQDRGHYKASFILPAYFLNSGAYFLSIVMGESQSVRLAEVISALKFKVHNNSLGANYSKFPGVVRPKLDWFLVKSPAP
jgi:lipopolysaccharide transport system ATP-binding protein